MHKDFAKKRRIPTKFKRRTQRHFASMTSASPSWIWMASGLILGLTLSSLLYWKMHPQRTVPRDAPIAIKENPPKKSEKSASKPQTASRFDFYTVLPENEAKADPYFDPASTAQNTVAQEEPITKPIANPHQPEIKPFKPNESKPFAPAADPYILQVGSFRHFEQADKLPRSSHCQDSKPAFKHLK